MRGIEFEGVGHVGCVDWDRRGGGDGMYWGGLDWVGMHWASRSSNM